MQTTMANKIGSIPEFTSEDDTPSSGSGLTYAEQAELQAKYGAEVSVSSAEQAVQPETVEEKETPSELPAEQTPDEQIVEDIGEPKVEEISRQVKGLQEERRKLILELGELRGERKQTKQVELEQLQEKIDDLKDLHPQDVQTIDRILKAKGYVPKESIDHMFYESRKQEEINNFLSEFREYDEKNDPDGRKFQPLIQELKLYKEPQDPKMYGTLLRRAHSAISGTQVSSGRATQARQHQAKVASVGAGGSQRSSSVKTLNDKTIQILRDGGWSEEEIEGMKKR